jgi:hypothetical protein
MIGRFIGGFSKAGGTPPSPNVTTKIGVITGTTNGVGAATLSMPTHLAPTGTQKDLFVSIQVNSVDGTLPTAPTGQDWTTLATATTAVSGALSAFRVIWKYASDASEVYGTDATNAHRCLLAHYRLTNAPADPFGALTIDSVVKSSGTGGNVVRWTAHASVTNHHVLTAILVKSNVTPTHRSDTIDQDGVAATSGKVWWGVSNGVVSSWAQQDTSSSASSATHSVAVPIIP